MPFYVAFLRGINSGQHPSQRMENLRRIFTKIGFRNVQTVIASGNVLFESDIIDRNSLEEKIENALKTETGIETAVIIRIKDEILRVIDKNPFNNVKKTIKNRFYATFLKDRLIESPKNPVNGKGYQILDVVDGMVFSVVDLSETRTPLLMSDLEKKFGKNITTRSWNTILKIQSFF